MAFHIDSRATKVTALAALVVTFVRQAVQHKRYSWDSFFDFFMWWSIHYAAVIIVVGVAYAITYGKQFPLFGKHEPLRKLSLEDGMVYGSIVVIVVAIAIFLIAHWVPVEIND